MTAPTTALQDAVRRAFDVVADERDKLSDEEYRAFVAILHERVEGEIVRLARGEALRLTRTGWDA